MIGRGFALLGVLVGLTTLGSAGYYELRPLDPPTFPKNPYGGTLHCGENSWAYGTHQNGYGASAENCEITWCEGTITAEYVWVRDQIPDPDHPGQMIADPLDNPPTEVISWEYCLASAEADTTIGGILDADASNGLGFEPQAGNDGSHAWSISMGTLYRKRAGGESTVLTCIPEAFALSDISDARVSIRYRSGIIVPRVSLVGVTRFYSPHALKFLTGQQVSASVSGVQLPIAKYSWYAGPAQGSDPNVDARIFRNYVHTTSLGKKYLHTKADKSQPVFSFYTANKGSLLVECEMEFGPAAEGERYEGGLPAFTARSREIESVRPTVTDTQPATGTVSLYPTMFMFGGIPETPIEHGQEWVVTIQVDPPFTQAGQGCFVQLITANRELLRNPLNGRPSRFVYSTTGALDTGFPYPFLSGVWNVSGSGRFVDSPFQGLGWDPGDGGGTDWYRSSANDSFQVWAMYRPPSVQNQPTTWIPLRRYTWQWSGVAERIEGVWYLTSSGGGVVMDPDDLTIHPEWTTFSPANFVLWSVP